MSLEADDADVWIPQSASSVHCWNERHLHGRRSRCAPLSSGRI